jgi:hypothetical protein
MHDERVVAGPSFGLKNFAHRRIVASVSRQAIHGFSGQAQQITPLQSLRGLRDRCGKLTVQNHGEAFRRFVTLLKRCNA